MIEDQLYDEWFKQRFIIHANYLYRFKFDQVLCGKACESFDEYPFFPRITTYHLPFDEVKDSFALFINVLIEDNTQGWRFIMRFFGDMYRDKKCMEYRFEIALKQFGYDMDRFKQHCKDNQ